MKYHKYLAKVYQIVSNVEVSTVNARVAATPDLPNGDAPCTADGGWWAIVGCKQRAGMLGCDWKWLIARRRGRESGAMVGHMLSRRFCYLEVKLAYLLGPQKPCAMHDP